MSTEVGIAKNALEVLSKASELASAFAAASEVLKVFKDLTAVCPLVGAVLGLIQAFLPDANHEEILCCFEKLNRKIGQVRSDIRDLEKMIDWEFTNLQYGEVLNRIQLALEYCLAMGNATETDEKIRFQDRLKEICANQEFTLALDALFDGITGTELFSSSILDSFYKKTEGHRPNISSLSVRLLQLVSGGMIVLATYETIVRGREGADEMAKIYNNRMISVQSKVKSVLDKCKTDFREHMLRDLNRFLDTGRPNEDLSSEVSNFMTSKYDWLQNFCLVYDDLRGFQNQCFSGSRVESLHRNGKCGIVFYRNSDDSPQYSDKCDEAKNIIEDEVKHECNQFLSDFFTNPIFFPNAERVCNKITSQLEQKGIGWVGCAVMRRDCDLQLFLSNFAYVIASVVGSIFTSLLAQKFIGWIGSTVINSNYDLRFGGNFSSATVSVDGRIFTVILMLS